MNRIDDLRAKVPKDKLNPLWLLTIVMLTLVAFPGIDLGISELFYHEGEGFFLRHSPVLEFIRKDVPPMLIGGLVLIIVLAATSHFLNRVIFGITPRVALFLSSSLIIGPGLIVNSLFKSHWGRARPSQILEFGGTAEFTPPLMMANQCATNCSFTSGHAALGFWVFAFALLVPPSWRPHAMTAAFLFGCMVGMVRIMQGGHFFSDVVFSAIIVIPLCLWLHRVILVERRSLPRLFHVKP
ncbi:phosphatase PAP2 family protein [Telmatospirillum sp. J64-1]|uniref:phosphatase PAP2 family protein n=1 Tax=Telmatospirillum sp. J64-1 TaxID=2502183 RepID=UPI00115F49D3|nr:phosphatase PAP2 family protein [Telmatospirillum sp. J64-1]